MQQQQQLQLQQLQLQQRNNVQPTQIYPDNTLKQNKTKPISITDNIEEETDDDKQIKKEELGFISVNKERVINELKTPLLLFILFTMLTSFQYLDLLDTYVPRLANVVVEGQRATNVMGMLMKSMIFVVLFTVIRRYIL